MSLYFCPPNMAGNIFSYVIFSSKAPLSQETHTHPNVFRSGSWVCLFMISFLFPFSLLDYSLSFQLEFVHILFLRCLIIYVVFSDLWPAYLFRFSCSLLCYSECLCIKCRSCRSCLMFDRIQPTRLSGDLHLKLAWAWIVAATQQANK